MGKVINQSYDGRWVIVEENERYYFFDTAGKKPTQVSTPAGNMLNTSYLKLAECILHDLGTFGTNSMSAESLLPWHFTMIDNFVKMERNQIEEMLDECFLQRYDWTYDVSIPKYASVFGAPRTRISDIRAWLSKCTYMQMTAACCIGNAYHSLNLAYVLAVLVENYSGKMLEKQFDALATIMEETGEFDDKESALLVFKNFNVYYGIHNEEHGAIIKKEFSLIETPDPITDWVVTEEMLIGRNYYHYIDGKRDEQQPFALLSDLSEIEEDPAEDEEVDDDELGEFLPCDCWVKKIHAYDDDLDVYIIAISVSNGKVENISVVRDEISVANSGLFFIPGMAMNSSHYFEEVDEDDFPEAIDLELEFLKAGRYLPNNFTFIGKKLPQKILDRGGNGGDMTDHTYALQSVYRLAYMHMSVTTTEEGIVEDLDYSTYQSSGSAYGDMFSRPQSLDDSHEEIIDMLLYILDLYTDEELCILNDAPADVTCAKTDSNKPEETESFFAIAAELLPLGRPEGYILSEGIPHIPELVAPCTDVCTRLLDWIYEYGKEHPDIRWTHVSLAWCAFAGIGAVHHWHVNWNELSQKGIFETLTEERGVFAMDEYIMDCIGKPQNSREGKKLFSHISNIAQCAEFRAISKGSLPFEDLLAIAKAMYLYGMVLEMNALGML